MIRILITLLAGSALFSLAACGTGDDSSPAMTVSGGDSSSSSSSGSDSDESDDSDGEYAVGGTAVVIQDNAITSISDSSGSYTEDDDGNVSVTFTAGPYAGQTVSFSESNDQSQLDGQTATLEAFLGADDDTSSGAMYVTVGGDDSLDGTYVAIYGGDTLSDLPQEGTGTYQGEYFGSAVSGDASGLVSGSSEISVNFQDGSVAGGFSDLKIYDDDDQVGTLNDIGFTGTLDKTSGAYTADSITLGGNSVDASSVVEGSLYGSGADSTAGSAAVVDSMTNPTQATVGVFQADRTN